MDSLECIYLLSFSDMHVIIIKEQELTNFKGYNGVDTKKAEEWKGKCIMQLCNCLTIFKISNKE